MEPEGGVPMKQFNILLTILIALLFIPTANADIYEWTDENGVKHFTNYAPPKQAKVLMKTPEIPYDEEADKQRGEIERLEIARQELAERESRLLQQQQEAEQRIAASNRRAQQALQDAEAALEEAEASAENNEYRRSTGSYYGYYPYSGYGYSGRYYRGYYRKDGGIYYYERRNFKHTYRDNDRYHRHYTKKHLDGRYSSNYTNRQHYKGYHRGFKPQRPSHRARVQFFRMRHGRFY
jgi:hypothetical protein